MPSQMQHIEHCITIVLYYTAENQAKIYFSQISVTVGFIYSAQDINRLFCVNEYIMIWYDMIGFVEYLCL